MENQPPDPLSFPGPKISTVAEPSSPWRPAKTCMAKVKSSSPQKMVALNQQKQE